MDQAAIPPETGNRVNELLEVLWICNSISFVIFSLRILTRWKITRNLGMQDCILTIGVLISLAAGGVASNMVSNGLGRHDYHLTPAELTKVVQLAFVAVILSIGSLIAPKYAVMLMLKGLMGPTSQGRWILYGVMTILIASSVVWVVLQCLQCIPLEGLWNPAIQADCGLTNAYTNMATFSSVWSAVTDLVFALFPITIVWNLRITLRKKLSICCIMGLGVFASVAAVIKTTKVASLTKHSDFSWDIVDVFIWACVEINLVIVCACFPSLPALYRYVTDPGYRRSLHPTSHNKPFLPEGSDDPSPSVKSPKTAREGSVSTEKSGPGYQINKKVDIEQQWSALE